jgi:hypothetical protein
VQRGARNRLECAALTVRIDKRRRSADVRRRKEGFAIVAEQCSEFGLADMGGIRQNRPNTGFSSPGEELMTRSTSAVAFSRSRASSRSRIS